MGTARTCLGLRRLPIAGSVAVFARMIISWHCNPSSALESMTVSQLRNEVGGFLLAGYFVWLFSFSVGILFDFQFVCVGISFGLSVFLLVFCLSFNFFKDCRD